MTRRITWDVLWWTITTEHNQTIRGPTTTEHFHQDEQAARSRYHELVATRGTAGILTRRWTSFYQRPRNTP